MQHTYSKEEDSWIIANKDIKFWRSQKHFTDTFNAIFGTNLTYKALFSHIYKKLGIQVTCQGRMSKKDKEWLISHASLGVYDSLTDFVNDFNSEADVPREYQAVCTWLSKNNIKVKTRYNTSRGNYSDDENNWLIDNYTNYVSNGLVDFVSMASDFNNNFGTNYSNCRIAKHCQRSLNIHNPKHKSDKVNKGVFSKGNTGTSTQRQLPIGTIRYNSDGRPFIKVRMCEGDSGGNSSHNYKEPWWKPLQKKIWEDHYGEVPDGYRVVSLNGNPCDTDINNIGLIDNRGTAVMAKKGWWTENSRLTDTAVAWCNLYYTAKDNGVDV